MNSMNAIITVVGTDQVGIIAKLSNALASYNINIDDITQTVLSGSFVMMMKINLSASTIPIHELRAEMNKLGEELGLVITTMHEQVFDAMHRI